MLDLDSVIEQTVADRFAAGGLKGHALRAELRMWQDDDFSHALLVTRQQVNATSGERTGHATVHSPGGEIRRDAV
jgi:hypothetical protein